NNRINGHPNSRSMYNINPAFKNNASFKSNKVITNQAPTTNNNNSTNTTMLLSQIQALATTLQAAQNSQTNTLGVTTSLLFTHEYMAGRKRTRLK
ncbi:11022_t:CDS:1, partial [Ambispora gerdemannii]